MTHTHDEIECAPTLVAVRTIPGQPAPFLVTTARPLSVVACEALAAADRLLVGDGALLAVQRADSERLHVAPLTR